MKLSGYIKGFLDIGMGFLRLIAGLFKKPQYLLGLILIILGIFYAFGIKPQEIPSWWSEKASPAISSRFGDFTTQVKKTTAPVVTAVGDVVEQTGKNIPIVKTIQEGNKKKEEEEPPFVPQTRPVWGKRGAMEQQQREAVALLQPAEKPVFRPVEKPDVKPADEVPVSQRRRVPVVSQPVLTGTSGGRTEMWPSAAPEIQETSQISPQPNETSNRKLIEGTAAVIGGDHLKVKGMNIRLKNIRIRSGRNSEAFRFMTRRYNGLTLKCYYDEADKKEAIYADCYQGRESLSQELIDMGLAN